MRATLLREKLDDIIAAYGDVDLLVKQLDKAPSDIKGFFIPMVRDFEKEERGYIICEE